MSLTDEVFGRTVDQVTALHKIISLKKSVGLDHTSEDRLLEYGERVVKEERERRLAKAKQA